MVILKFAWPGQDGVGTLGKASYEWFRAPAQSSMLPVGIPARSSPDSGLLRDLLRYGDMHCT